MERAHPSVMMDLLVVMTILIQLIKTGSTSSRTELSNWQPAGFQLVYSPQACKPGHSSPHYSGCHTRKAHGVGCQHSTAKEPAPRELKVERRHLHPCAQYSSNGGKRGAHVHCNREEPGSPQPTLVWPPQHAAPVGAVHVAYNAQMLRTLTALT